MNVPHPILFLFFLCWWRDYLLNFSEYSLPNSNNPDLINNIEERVWTKALQESKSLNSKWTQDDLVTAIELVRGGTPIKPAAERCAIPVMTLWRRTKALGMVSSRASHGRSASRRKQKYSLVS